MSSDSALPVTLHGPTAQPVVLWEPFFGRHLFSVRTKM